MRIGTALTGSCYYCNLLLAATALRHRTAAAAASASSTAATFTAAGFVSPNVLARGRWIGGGCGRRRDRPSVSSLLDGRRGFRGTCTATFAVHSGGVRNSTVLTEEAAEVAKDAVTTTVARGRMTGDEKSSRRRPSGMYVASRNGAEMPWVDVHGRSAMLASGPSRRAASSSSTSGARESGASGAMMCNVADEVGRVGGVVRGDDGIHPTPLDATSLLKLLPRGAYTTCRTVDGGTKVYQFEYHANRLAESAKEMIDDEGVGVEREIIGGGGGKELVTTTTRTRPIIDPDVYGAVTDYARVRDATLSTVRSTVDAFRRRYGDRLSRKDEFRITLLSTWLPPGGDEDATAASSPATANEANLYCHVGVLPKRREGERIRVEVHGRGRSHAAAKDSRWVSERENSSEIRDDVEEFVLVDDRGHMLEGTQTNFYLVGEHGAVITADDGILRGSVRDSVLRVCADPGDDGVTIPVELRPPTMDDLRDARGAFLTSTSRMVMPVHEVVVNVTRDDVADGGSTDPVTEVPEGATVRFPDCEVTERIRRLVLEDVKTHCVSIE